MLTIKRLAAALVAGAAILVLTAMPAPACTGFSCDELEPEASEGAIAITVTQTSVLPGGTVGDSSTGSGTSTVYFPPPCTYEASMTGAEYYEYVESGDPYVTARGTGEGPYEPHENYEDHQDDTEGRWYYPSCNSGAYADYFGYDHQEQFSEFFDDFVDYYTEYYDENDTIYVEAGETPPVPDIEIPPEILMQVAHDEMELPEPEVAWNPSRTGDAATFVNLDTWVWVDESPILLEVNATAGANEATVTATLDTTTVSAPDATGDTCPGAGVPWAADANEDAACQIVFNRSSANQPGQVTPVTVETNWTVEWSANGVPQGTLDPQTLTAVNNVPVAEVQTIVTGG